MVQVVQQPKSAVWDPEEASMIEECATCRFWLKEEKENGVCRRHAPKPEGMAKAEPPYEDTFKPLWPSVDREWWCGEYKSGHSQLYDPAL